MPIGILQHLARESALIQSDTIQRTLEAIRTHLEMDVAYVSEFVGNLSVMRQVDAPGLEDLVKPGDANSLDDVYCRHILEGRLPELMPDTSQIPFAAAMPITAMIGSHVSVPLRRPDGVTYGMFCCFSSKPKPSLNERDLNITRAFASLAAEQIGRDLESTRERDEKIARIRSAIDAEAFSPVLQPIVDLYSNQTMGYECLTRFAALPLRTPDLWFNEAAEIGLGTELELAALRCALKSFAHLPEDVTLSLNVTPETLLHDGFPAIFAGWPLNRVVLEVTEHAEAADYDALRVALKPMRAKGLKLAVDDAGAGYASLHHILKLEPDMIKLDMSLTRDVHTDPAKRSLAAALLLFARQTGSEIVAEGIETAEELEVLKSLGISKGQGYLLGRPAPLEEAVASLKSARAAPYIFS